MSIALIVTRGFSNGTLTGSIADVIRRGYSADAVVSVSTAIGGAKKRREYRYDFGEHYPYLPPQDKARIDEVIDALRPVQRANLAAGKPSKAVRRKIAKILPQYATYTPKPITELMSEAQIQMEDRLEMQRLAQEENDLLMLILLSA